MSIVGGKLRAAYEAWCRSEGEEPVSAKKFTTELKRHGVTTKRSASTRYYAGVHLNHTADESGW
ncbi:hypothetical protein [Nocardiopsis gilva]|nr:hypothetical protein [Nocardiopsis gilva]